MLLEKQRPELLRINSAISDMIRVYFKHVGQAKSANEESTKKDYQEAAAKAREVINRNPFLFDLDFNIDLDRYFEIHRRMSRLSIAKWGRYRQFAACLSNEFDDLCRSVLEGTRNQPSRMRMTLADISFKKASDMSAED